MQRVPAIDSCEPQVVRALDKADWAVTDRPAPIWIGQGRKFVYADLRLEHRVNHEQAIIVEVKCFPNKRNQLHEFYTALGQYLLYRTGLELRRRTERVYLAMPEAVYQTLQRSKAVRVLLRQQAVHLILIDLDREEIVRWIH